MDQPLGDRTVTIEGSNFAVAFPYPRDMALTVALKGAISQRSFRDQPKRWLIPILPGPAHDLAAFAAKYRFTISPAAREMLARHGSGDRPADRRMEILPSGEMAVHYCNLSPTDFGLILSEMRDLAGPSGWRALDRSWRIPINGRTAPRLKAIAERWEFHLESAAAAALGIAASAPTIDETAALRERLNGFVSTKGDRLMPFQEDCPIYVYQRRRCYLGDDVGLGKTVQTLAAAWLCGAFPLIVVCQADLKIKWMREAWRWLPGKTVKLVSGSKDSIPRADVIILNHEILHHHEAALKAIRPEMVAIDEAHKCKTVTAKRTKAAMAIFDGVSVRMLLSATPMPNRPQEWRAPLSMLGVLDKFGGWGAFSKRYCRATRKTILVWDKRYNRRIQRTITDTGGSANEMELHRRLVDLCFLRRTKDQVMDQLPEKIYITIPLEIDNRAEYETARDSFETWLADRMRLDKDLLARTAGMSQEDAALYIEDHIDSKIERSLMMEAQQRMAALKTLAEKGKTPAAIRWIRSFLEDSPGKIYVSAYSRDVQSTLAQAFSGAARIHADDPHSERQANVDRFQHIEDCRILIASLIAGQTGHDLTAAHSMAHVGLWWRPMDYDQMEGRGWGRMNDPHGLTAYFLVAAGTIEEEIIEMVSKKRRRVSAVVDGKRLTDEDETVFDAVLSRMRLKVSQLPLQGSLL